MKIGAKLKMTEAAIRMGLDGQKHRRTGVCISSNGRFIRVKRYGMPHSEIWHPKFWEEAL